MGKKVHTSAKGIAGRVWCSRLIMAEHMAEQRSIDGPFVLDGPRSPAQGSRTRSYILLEQEC